MLRFCHILFCLCLCTYVRAGLSVKQHGDSMVYVQSVSYTGQHTTKIYILQREVAVLAQQTYTWPELRMLMQRSKEQLMNTRLFVETEVVAAGTDTVQIQVMVKERWYLFPVPYFKLIDRSFNDWWVTHRASLKRVNYGAKLKWYNVSGRNDKLDVSVTSGYNQEVRVHYSQPFADPTLRHGFEAGIRYQRQHETSYNTLFNKPLFLRLEKEYVRSGGHVLLGYSYRPGSRHRHSVRLSYVWDQVLDSVLKLNPQFNGLQTRNIQYPELQYTWEYYGADYNPYPLKGVILNTNVMIRGLHQDMHLTQLNASALWALPLPGKWNLLLQGTTTVKLPLEQSWYNQPLYNYGGPFMRGTEYYVIDGVAGVLGRATLRHPLVCWNIKNPLPGKSRSNIPFAIFGKAYSDAGYFHQPGNQATLLNNRFARSGGIGIDFLSFYDLVIRFEYTFNQLGEKGLFIHSGKDW